MSKNFVWAWVEDFHVGVHTGLHPQWQVERKQLREAIEQALSILPS